MEFLPLSIIESQINYIFNNKELLICAISYKGQELIDLSKLDQQFDQKKLAFLGDGLITHVTSEFLVRNKRKSLNRGFYISNSSMANWVRGRNLTNIIPYLFSNDYSNHMLGTLFEALIYAIYLDCNRQFEFIYEYLEANYYTQIHLNVPNYETQCKIIKNQKLEKSYSQLNNLLYKLYNTEAIVEKEEPTHLCPLGKVTLRFNIVNSEGVIQQICYSKITKITPLTVEVLANRALKKLKKDKLCAESLLKC